MRLTLTANIPSNADHVGVYLDLKDATGTVWFDGIQLETGKTANRLNLLNDADIDQGAYWTYYMPGMSSPFHNGLVELYGEPGRNAYVYQTVPVNKADVCFNVYGTVQGKSVPTQHEDRTFWLELAISPLKRIDRKIKGKGNGK